MKTIILFTLMRKGNEGQEHRCDWRCIVNPDTTSYEGLPRLALEKHADNALGEKQWTEDAYAASAPLLGAIMMRLPGASRSEDKDRVTYNIGTIELT